MRLQVRNRLRLSGLLLLCAGVITLGIDSLSAQQQRRRVPPAVAKEMSTKGQSNIKREQQPGARESVEADVSARNVAVTSSFNGT